VGLQRIEQIGQWPHMDGNGPFSTRHHVRFSHSRARQHAQLDDSMRAHDQHVHGEDIYIPLVLDAIRHLPDYSQLPVLAWHHLFVCQLRICRTISTCAQVHFGETDTTRQRPYEEIYQRPTTTRWYSIATLDSDQCWRPDDWRSCGSHVGGTT